jgi:GNAT superfamily N-acetyltransferase
MHIEEGTTKDWRELSIFHYRSHRIAAPRKIVYLRRDSELCGVIVHCYPPSTSFGRRLVLPHMQMRELNEKLSAISRVVVHPKYRTIGLGTRLVQESLPLADTNYVEMSAVMAKYNPFAEKAGMKKIIEQESPKEALAILKVLEGFDFNNQDLVSERRALEKLQTLDNKSIERIKEAFVKYNHPRFMKAFSYHLPFGLKRAYQEQMEHLSLEKLAHLLKICGFLMQTKVYLFCRKQNC